MATGSLGKTLHSPAAARTAQERGDDHPAAAAAGNFLRSWHVLLRLVRLYDPAHPQVGECLKDAERELHAALEKISPLAFSLENGSVRLRGQALADAGGELKMLVGDLSRHSISSILFFPGVNSEELCGLVQLLELVRRSKPAGAKATGGSPQQPSAGSDWNHLLDGHGIRNIRINVPVEQKASTFTASLLSALTSSRALTDRAARALLWPATRSSQNTGMGLSHEELLATVRLLQRLGPALVESNPRTANGAVRAVSQALVQSDLKTARILAEAVTLHRPEASELLEPYFQRLAEILLLEFFRERFQAGQIAAADLRAQIGSVVRELARPTGMATGAARQTPAWFGLRGDEETCAERLYARFWGELPARERAIVLRGSDVWCIPMGFLRPYLEQVAKAGGTSEGRFLLLNYARGLESNERMIRSAVANGLGQFAVAIEQLWPRECPEELCRGVARTLTNELIPEVAAALTEVMETLAERAIHNADWSSYEVILDLLETRPRDAVRVPAAALAERLLAEDRWQKMVDAALGPGPPSASLARILGRNPERLLDRFGALLAAARGMDQLPAMARLLTAIGEPATGALVGRLSEPRAQRVAVAVKLLAATKPPRLVAALPRVLPSWDWSLQDLAVSELARLNPPGAARAMLEALPDAHPMVAPLILDQIGMAGETAAVPALVAIAAGRHAPLRDVFVRIKAVEALGRLRAKDSAEVLRTILRQRNGLTHAEPPGLRAAAEEALGLIENWPSSARVRKIEQALSKTSQSFTRPRRYLRIPLPEPLSARIERERPFAARVKTISLGGAFLESRQRLQVGDSFPVQIRAGFRRIRGRAVVRNISPDGGGVEFVHMNSEDRERLRRLVNHLARI